MRRDEVARLQTAKMFLARFDNGPVEALKTLDLKNPFLGAARWKHFHTEFFLEKDLLLVKDEDEAAAAAIDRDGPRTSALHKCMSK